LAEYEGNPQNRQKQLQFDGRKPDQYIIEHWKQRRAEINLEGDIFEIPAIVYRIELG